MVADRNIEIDDRRNPNIITNKSTYLGFVVVDLDSRYLDPPLSPLPKFPTLVFIIG